MSSGVAVAVVGLCGNEMTTARGAGVVERDGVLDRLDVACRRRVAPASRGATRWIG